MGRCPRCGSWESLHAKTEPFRDQTVAATLPATATRLADFTAAERPRYSSGLSEVDRVLGGGWVPGGVLLIAGEPGIGKSTLLMQLAHHALKAGRDTLYIAGEESPSQVKLRAERLGVAADLKLTRDTQAAAIAAHIESLKPGLVIVDSIQTLTTDQSPAPGSLTNVRDGTAILTRAAKQADTTLVLIGHVTKEGSIAGPKVIEHMVDATLALETASGFRVLRAIKNRYGPAGEMGVFEMTVKGLQPVTNPSQAFLAERPLGVPGSAVVAALEGQRPLLLEVQALAARSPYPSPRRITQGLDYRRVDVILAVLERRLELPLANLDIYINIAGGIRLTDPGVDLAVALATYSAVMSRPIPDETAFVGEVGLAGELRTVPQLERRSDEARRAGYKRVISPGAHVDRVSSLSAAVKAVWEATPC